MDAPRDIGTRSRSRQIRVPDANGLRAGHAHLPESASISWQQGERRRDGVRGWIQPRSCHEPPVTGKVILAVHAGARVQIDVYRLVGVILDRHHRLDHCGRSPS